jgi:hypothetical protein
MEWPWHIRTDHTADDKAARRILLDRYGLYAQLSALIPIALYWLYVLAVWVFRARQSAKGYEAVPGSPHQKKVKATSSGRAVGWGRRITFWLQGPGINGQDKVKHNLAGIAWAAWMVFLSVNQTGDGELCLFFYRCLSRDIVGPMPLIRVLMSYSCFAVGFKLNLESFEIIYSYPSVFRLVQHSLCSST